MNYPDTKAQLILKLFPGMYRLPDYVGLRLCLRNRWVIFEERFEKIGPSEFMVLWLFIRSQGALISNDEIYYFLYEEANEIPLGNVLEVIVQRLRAKLLNITPSFEIEKFRSIGYRISYNPI